MPFPFQITGGTGELIIDDLHSSDWEPAPEPALPSTIFDYEGWKLGSNAGGSAVYLTFASARRLRAERLWLHAPWPDAENYREILLHEELPGRQDRDADCYQETVDIVPSGSLTTTTSHQVIPGLTYTIPANTDYDASAVHKLLICAYIYATQFSAGADRLIGELYIDGSAYDTNKGITTQLAQNTRSTSSRMWTITYNPRTGVTVDIRAKHVGGVSYNIPSSHTGMTVNHLSLGQYPIAS